MSTELYRKHRPKKLEDIIGQPEVIRQLQGFVKSKTLPHTLLLTGPSGTGKTTIARILARRILKCKGKDFIELNCASSRGIDTIRDIEQKMSAFGMHGKARCFCLDECHMLTGEGKSALLKITEDMPNHVHFFLATTNPSKLLRTLITRSSPINLRAIGGKDMESLLKDICNKESVAISQEISDKIISVSEGSARMALVNLQRVLQVEKDKDRIVLLSMRSDAEAEGIDLIRYVMNGHADFKGAMNLIKGMESPDIEGIRLGALGYVAVMLSNGVTGTKQTRCLRVIRAFRDNFFDSGKAGLIGAIYETVTGADLP